jgi:hypothetical protein
MSKFDYRLKSLEKNFPVPDVGSFLESLTEVELEAIILAMHRFQLAHAKETGDKSLVADLALIIKHDSAELRRLPKEDVPSPKKVKRLLIELMEAKDDGAEFQKRGDIEDDFRQRMKKQAEEIRFAAKFQDLLSRLESGAIVEYTDANQMPIAMAKMLPDEKPDSAWRTVEMISSYVPHRKEYVDLERCRDDVEGKHSLPRRWKSDVEAGVWRPWKTYCVAADKERKDILAGKKAAPSVKPAPSATAAAPAPPKPAKPAPPPVIKPAEPPPMMVHELQRILRGRRP